MGGDFSESRSVYVKEFPRDWKTKDVHSLFSRKIGNVERVDMKDNYCFVIFHSPADAKEAAKVMMDYDTGRTNLIVELAKGDQDIRKSQAAGNLNKSEVLFVVNFDKDTTRERDVRDFFNGYDVVEVEMWQGGKGIKNKNFCFVTMADLRSAVEAKERLDGTYLGDRMVTVEYKTGNKGKQRRRSRSRSRDRRRRDRSYSRDRSRDRRRSDRDRSRDRSRDYAPYPKKDRYRSETPDSRDRDRRRR